MTDTTDKRCGTCARWSGKPGQEAASDCLEHGTCMYPSGICPGWTPRPRTEGPSHYTDHPAPPEYTAIVRGVRVDTYDVLDGFGVTNPAAQHGAKKALLPGVRNGGKSKAQDFREGAAALIRAAEIEEAKG